MILLSWNEDFYWTKTNRKRYDPAVVICYLLIDICIWKYKYSYDWDAISNKIVNELWIRCALEGYYVEELDWFTIPLNKLSDIYNKYYNILIWYKQWIPDSNLDINPKPFLCTDGSASKYIYLTKLSTQPTQPKTSVFQIWDKVLHSWWVAIIERLVWANKYKLKWVRSYKSREDIKLFDYDLISNLYSWISDNSDSVDISTLSIQDINEVCSNVQSFKSKFDMSDWRECKINLFFN